MSRRSPNGKLRTISGATARRRLLALSLVLAVACTALVATSPVRPAVALSGSEFDPGYIISDELFYDGGAMSATQIQDFLNSKIGTCQTDRCLNVAVVPVASRPAAYSSSNNALLCSAIAGGSLLVSELIYRTQVACGISAKVILVTLQKEQGLVTNRAPSDRALRAAMGMGCPDTAPCDDAFAGLANQIITGTRQLITYKAGNFARQPGVHFVRFSPDSSCGGTDVNVRNYATAALYNYTPYQPNAASLANIGTVGDGCSSYGNRNFWVYYTNWFGPTTEVPCTVNPSRDITRYWEEQGAAGGAFGELVSPGIVAGPFGTTIGSFANGDVYCTPRLGAAGVLGDIRAEYDALGAASSPLGSPLGSSRVFSAGGITGLLQDFQRGMILSSALTGTFAVVQGPIRNAWAARGGSGGSLGWPTGSMQSSPDGLMQEFQNGVLVVPTGQSAVVLSGAIGTYWSSGSNSDALGLPTGASMAFSANGVSGTLQYFGSGLVLSSVQTGTFAVLHGAIRTKWGALGGSGGSLGWPTGDRQTLAGGFVQSFQGGTLFASTSGAGATMSTEMAAYWQSGSIASLLGFPSAAAVPWSAGGVSGRLQYFETGMVLSSSQTGTISVLNGPIRNLWGSLGGSSGSLGWPTGEQHTISGELRQQFQRGAIVIPTGVTGEIAVYVASGTNSSLLGASTGPSTAWTAGGVSGQLQYFQRGMVLSSATTGTFGVFNGSIRDAWGGLGGTSGSLGWPTGDQQTIAGGVRQQFQNGVILGLTGRAAVVLSGAVATYWADGSHASLFGAPTGSAAAWVAGGVSGQLQYFQRGLVLSSSATGTFGVLSGRIRDAWGVEGGSGGSLGWPIGDQESVSVGVLQQFQGGFVFVPTGGAGVILKGAFADYWRTGSNATLFGAPTASLAPWTAGGVSGQLQYYQRGIVLSSASTGTFGVINGPLRTAWGNLGGTGGSMGWPTGDQQIVDGVVRQTFQNGVLAVTGLGTTVTLTGELYRYWSTTPNSTSLGSPLEPKMEWSAGAISGEYQVFKQGMVMSSSVTGTYAVLNGPIRTTWGAAGGSGGTLGWPTGDQVVVPEGIRQQFQHGAIVVPPVGEPYISAG